MRHAHAMPFGAELRELGVRFRLWAPSAERVDVELDPEGDEPRTRPLEARAGGWFELEWPGLAAGTDYRFRIDGGTAVPDPASRHQPRGVHAPSRIVDPGAYAWRDDAWRGRPWPETVLYELHVGTFTPDGTFDGVRRRLDRLAALGVTAVELMPVAAFSGERGWGYDGVLPFAPHVAYGGPAGLKALVDEAHERELMVFLDVVYNHFGPDGNYLHEYAPEFFTDRFHTPWGDAIDYSRDPVRAFAIHNALYWLEEYRIDGLRLDAVHAIRDDRSPDVLEALARTVRSRVDPDRHVHLVLENGDNEARYLARDDGGRAPHYDAQWNDDVHHALHVLATGEEEGYYRAYADDPLRRLARCLAEGFAYQGEPFPDHEGRERGEPSGHLPPTAFVVFLQNHDQIGNRAMGERLAELADPAAVEALTAVLLLAPHPPLLFMGEEWGAPEPFLYFCDFHDELAVAVREGRRREFAGFSAFADEAARRRIPDPNAVETFRRSVLDWNRREREPHRARLERVRDLLALRRKRIVPRLGTIPGGGARARTFGAGGLDVRWPLDGDGELRLVGNLSGLTNHEAPAVGDRELLYAAGRPPSGRTDSPAEGDRRSDPGGEETAGAMAPWSVWWFL